MKHRIELKRFASKAISAFTACALTIGMAPSLAFAGQLQAQDLEPATPGKDPSGYVIAAAFAAAEPAPEILGLNNPNFRNTGEADAIAVVFADDEANESVDPFVYNYANNLTPGIALAGRSGGPMAALKAYGTDEATNAVWAYLPHIVLGTGADAIPENEHDFYDTDEYARAVETGLGLDANSYHPIGVTYNRVTLPTMIATMYRLAEAAEEAMDDGDLKTRYEDPIEIAQNYERYVIGAKGYVLKAIDDGLVKKKTIALVQSYDADANAYTIITDGVAEGTATTNRYLEAVQGVTDNYINVVGVQEREVTDERGNKSIEKYATVTADQLKENVDAIIVGGNVGTGSDSLAVSLANDGLLDKTFYSTNMSNGAVFGVTVNSVENAQNVGRILACVYDEILDQSDMIAYYYDTLYHLNTGAVPAKIADMMDGVRNWNATDSAAYLQWEESDVEGYDAGQVESILKTGVAYLNQQVAAGKSFSDYLVPSSYLEDDTDFLVGSQTISAEDKSIEIGKTVDLGAKVTNGSGALSYKSSDAKVATVDAKGVVTAKGVGTATITVTAAKDGYFTETAKDVKVTVTKAAQAISAADKSVVFGKTVDLGAKVTTGNGALSYESSNAKVATVSNKGVVTAKGAGTANITITAAATANYKQATKTVKVTVTPADQAITAAAKSVAMGKTVSLGAKTSGDGALTYKSSNAKVAKVSAKGVVTPVKAGTANITITAAKSANYKQATKIVKVTVKQGKQSLTFKKATKSVKAAKVNKAKQTVAITKAKGAKTAVTYSIAKVNKAKKNFTINKKTGKITVKKGTKKGTYKVTVKATAAKTADWAKAAKFAVITIKVK